MCLGKSSADLLGQLDGVQGELFIRALGLYLERSGAVQIVAQVILDGIKNSIQVLLTGTAAAQAHHTKDSMAGLPGAVHIRQLIHRLHIDRGLHEIYIEITKAAHTAADILPQLGFKLALVGALQDDLAQLQKKNFLHHFLLPR